VGYRCCRIHQTKHFSQIKRRTWHPNQKVKELKDAKFSKF
jgi:hypothetical protein